MKKTACIAFLILMIPLALFSETLFDSSLGFAFFTYQVEYNYENEKSTASEKGTGLTGNADIVFFGDSRTGLDVGFTFLYPLTAKINGEEAETSFASSEWIVRIGLAKKRQINDKFSMITSSGYQLLMNYCHFDDEELVVWSKTFLHGLYFQEKFIIKVEDSMTINAGLLFVFPMFGKIIYSSEGYEDMKVQVYNRGLTISPFIGVRF